MSDPAVLVPDPERTPPAAAVAPFPNLFVVGAPRCGTTALSSWLADHPQICFSKPKEPHFFTHLGDAAEPDLQTYERFFRHWHPSHRCVAEGSVSYLYDEQALPRILEANPLARFVAMVRDPKAMLPSYHQRMLYLLEEDAPFERAWALQSERAAGRRVPRLCTDSRLLLYRDAGSLGAQVERLFATAGRERCLVIVFDDLASDPAGCYRRVLEFAGVPDDGRSEFGRRLPSQRYRMRLLQRLLTKPPGVKLDLRAERIARADRKIRQRQLQRRKPAWVRLQKRVRRWNSVAAPPAPLSARMRRQLREALAPDVERLAKLLDRDLSHWL